MADLPYDDPRPSSQPVGTTELGPAKDNLITFDAVLNSDDETVTNRKGGTRSTLAGFDAEGKRRIVAIEEDAYARISIAIANAGYQDVGDYENDDPISTYNEYLVYQRGTTPTQWKVVDNTPLPYTPDSTTTPDPEDDDNLELFTEKVVVSSIAELQTRSTSTDSAIYLSLSGRSGWFEWDPSDLSAEIASDTRQGVYIAPNSDLTGASGAWVRKCSSITPEMFGAYGDGVTDDTLFIADAFKALKAGWVIEFSANKTYLVNPDNAQTYAGELGNLQSLFFISSDYVRVQGGGLILSERGVATASDLITIKGGLTGVTIDGLRYEGPELPPLTEDYTTSPGFVVTSVVAGEFGSSGYNHSVVNCDLRQIHFTAINFSATAGTPRVYKKLNISNNRLELIRGHGIGLRHQEDYTITNNKISEVRRYDASFVPLGIDASSGAINGVISGNIVNKAPYGMKLENADTEVVQSEFNIVEGNIFTDIGHPDSKPDDAQHAIKINGAKSIVKNNVVNRVYGPTSSVKGILVNRINADVIIESNIITGSPCGISDLPFRAVTGGPVTPGTDHRTRTKILNNIIYGTSEVSVPRNALEFIYDRCDVCGNSISGEWENGLYAFGQLDDTQSDVTVKGNNVKLDSGQLVNMRNNLVNWEFSENDFNANITLPTTVNDFRFKNNRIEGRVTFTSVGPSSLPAVRDTKNLIITGNTAAQIRFGSVPSGVTSKGVKCANNVLDKNLDTASTTGIFVISGFSGDESDFAPFTIENNLSIDYPVSIEMPSGSSGFVIRGNISEGSLSQPINWYDSDDVDIYSNKPSIYAKVGLFVNRPVSSSSKRLPNGTMYTSTNPYGVYYYQRGASFALDAWQQLV